MAKLSVVGIGPGDWRELTLRAVETLEAADVIVGYTLYVDLVRPHLPEKDFRATGMRGEAERCRLALELAREGKKVAVICSGDAGVYGMAGLIYELRGDEAIDMEVVGGLTAATSGAALLGAPLGHDFAVISLSDRLTPWELIEKRLACAVRAGLCLALYNPASHGRPEALKRACDVLLKYAAPETVCGVARNIGREGEAARLMTLNELRDYGADMFTTAFVGNASTKVIGGRMVTPRGYRDV